LPDFVGGFRRREVSSAESSSIISSSTSSSAGGKFSVFDCFCGSGASLAGLKNVCRGPFADALETGFLVPLSGEGV